MERDDAAQRRRRFLAAVLAGVLVATAGLVAAVIFYGGDDGGSADNPSDGGRPVTIDGVEFRPFLVGDAARLPETTALLVTTGCFDCAPPDHYIKTVSRVYRDSQGTLRTETLFAAKPTQPLEPPSAPLPEGAYILAVAAAPGASDVIVTVCLTGGCTRFDAAVERPAVALYRSTDGGVSWLEHGRLGGEPVRPGGDPPLPRVVAIGREGAVLVVPASAAARPAVSYYPPGPTLEVPAGAVSVQPGVTPAGDLAWIVATPAGLQLHTAGKSYPLPALAKDASIAGPPFFLDASRAVITSQVESSRPAGQWPRYYAVVSLESGLQLGWSGLRVEPGAVVSSAAVAADVTLPADRRATLGLSELPGLVDFDTGAVNTISVPFAGPGARTPAHVLAALRGPFARVVRRDGCAELLNQPSAAAQSNGCFAAGTLLRVTGADASGFVPVAAPDDRSGWVRVGHIER